MLSIAFPATEAVDRADRFDDLFERLYPRLYGLAYRLIGEQGETGDVLQAVVRAGYRLFGPVPRQQTLEDVFVGLVDGVGFVNTLAIAEITFREHSAGGWFWPARC